MIKLSIIIPIFNVSKKIKPLLNVLNKSTRNDIEIICVNDGSTDDTLDIINEYKIPNLVIYSKQNEGAFKSWIYGLKKCVGKYVTVLDGDDYIDEDYLDYIINFIDNIGADALITTYIVENNNKSKKCINPLEDGFYDGNELEKIRKKLISGRFSYSKATKVIKRDILVEYSNNTMNDNLLDFEDWLTWIILYSKIKSMYFTNEAFYHYIQYSNSITRQKSLRNNYNDFNKILTFLEKTNYVKLDNYDIKSINFYGKRSILNRCIKNKEFDLASEIMNSIEFYSFINNSNIKLSEKLIYKLRNPIILYLCIKIINLFRK